jgi:hypothetical protein
LPGVPRRRAAVAFGLALLPLAGCGTPSADLFAIQRTGTVPGARLAMVVSDGGTVQCNTAKAVDMTDQQLLDARELQRDLKDLAERHLDLPPRRGSVFRYEVRTPDGTVRFADNSPGARGALARLTLFVRQVAQQQCRLAR